jgi:pre-rRNA-processing protein TSR2
MVGNRLSSVISFFGISCTFTQPTSRRINMTTIEEFQAGVTACLRSWSAFRTAVDSGWGGGERESQAKGEALRQHIFELMDGKKFPPGCSDTDLADGLAIYLEEEFSTTVEDNSEQQVADVIFRMYEGLYKGDGSLCRQILSSAEGAIAFNSQFPVHIQTTEHDDDDDEDMTDTQGGVQNSSHAPAGQTASPFSEYLEQPLFGVARKALAPLGPARQLGEGPFLESVTEDVDDDGFAAVKPKGRRRNP